ncbi:hypothetical protein ACJRO7_018125 [Eucalyptus globulus]|uniref:Uncharacterized protein n=1 Tax=Eucalyptus globulus TaxID=34317 RepID=A0ABD3KTT1_EUCGL
MEGRRAATALPVAVRAAALLPAAVQVATLSPKPFEPPRVRDRPVPTRFCPASPSTYRARVRQAPRRAAKTPASPRPRLLSRPPAARSSSAPTPSRSAPSLLRAKLPSAPCPLLRPCHSNQ